VIGKRRRRRTLTVRFAPAAETLGPVHGSVSNRPASALRRGFRRVKVALRSEVQGLRAIAALLVATYHIWFARVSGGVDVFFVVSGFLVTHSLLNRSTGKGGLKPGEYLWDLYSRLGPPALIVVVTTSIGAALFLPHTDWPFNINEAVSAAFFFNNWHLALNAVDYLDRSGDPRPFQHFWALSAQWQFYFLWAALFFALQRVGPNRYRAAVAATLSTALVLSFALSVYQTEHDQPFAYFNTATRIWEFAAGGLLALFQPQAKPPAWIGAALGWLGLAAIVSCGALLPVASSFPGYAALVPVVAALLILTFGATDHPASVGRLLSWRPLVALGGISYPLYLWHWPLLVLWLSYTVDTRADFGEGVAILLVALLLSVATQALMRAKPGWLLRPASGAFAATLTGVTLAFCLGWRAQSVAARSVQMSEDLPPASTHPGALAIGRAVAPAPIFPGPFRVKSDYPIAYKQGCTQGTFGSEVITCTYGDPRSDVTIAVVGNSHVTHWLPALDLAGRERGWKVVLVTKNDCRLRSHPEGGSDDAVRACDQWNEKLPAVIHELAPRYVFTAASRREGSDEIVPDDYPKAWARLVPDPTQVIAVRGTPRFTFDVATCVDLHGAASAKCEAPRALALGESGRDLRAQVERSGASYVDLTRYFCDERRCFPTAGNVLIYRDHNHLTPSYVRTMKDAIADEVEAAMHRAEQASASG
jgi:peptidoglycan/LPS O-acetylase OafA/YrhL